MNINADTFALIRDEIGDFTISQVNGYLTFRFGFWRRINIYQLQDILGSEMMVFENEYDDDDVRTRYSYRVA